MFLNFIEKNICVLRIFIQSEREDAKNIPIIAMTANAFLDDIEHSKKAGMNEHVIKPLNMDELISKISKTVSGNKRE